MAFLGTSCMARTPAVVVCRRDARHHAVSARSHCRWQTRSAARAAKLFVCSSMMDSDDTFAGDDTGDDATTSTDETKPTHDDRSQLANVCFVLCRPQGPGNIGSIARVMNNFGITDLRIVTPEPGALEPPFNELLDDGSDRAVHSVEVRAIAPLANEATVMSVHASDLLKNAMRCETAKDAIRDCVFVAATTARPRENLQIKSARDAVCETLAQISRTGKIAILFGNEATGLTNEELALANLGVMIPTAGFEVPEQTTGGVGERNDEKSGVKSLEKKTTDSTKNKKQTQKPKRYTGGVGPTSLNLSHAVGVLAYEIHQAMGNNNVSGYNSRLISVEERVRLVDELHAARRSLDVFAAETSDASVDADVDESKTYSDPSQNRLESLEHERERRAFANVLNAGPIATRDATVLFTLARRVLENKPYSNTDDAVRAAATSFRETKNSGNKKNEEPSVKAVINAVRESCGISMTTRETERVLRALGEAMDE